MIIKYFEIEKINSNNIKSILLHGKNQGLKEEVINQLKTNSKNLLSYEEREILENETNFYENTLNRSLFEKEKLIVINRSTDKITKMIERILDTKLDDIFIILRAENLEKKSKLRNLFEKEKNLASVAFYPDTDQTLNKLAFDFMRKKKIAIPSSDINFIVSKCNGDRQNLLNELNKIEIFLKDKNKINLKQISKLINLSEDFALTELINNCLAKNKIKVTKILNENNYTNEDGVIIIRTLLNKLKNLLKLSKIYEESNDINKTISSAKPPIFWKEKEITKIQIYKLNSVKIKKLMFQLNDLELFVKKNLQHSLNSVTNFILKQSS